MRLNDNLVGTIATFIIAFAVGYFVASANHQQQAPSTALTPARVPLARFGERSRVVKSPPKIADESAPTNNPAPINTKERFLAARDTQIDSFVNGVAKLKEPGYDLLFQQMGLPAAVGNDLKDQMKEIHRYYLKMDIALGDVEQLRRQFNRNLTNILTAQQIEEFRRFEKTQHAQSQVREIATFSQANPGVFISPAYDDLVARLIVDSDAYTSQSFMGPFDGYPHLTGGTPEGVLAALDREIPELTAATNRLFSNPLCQQLPQEYLQALQQYYDDQIETRQKIRASAKIDFTDLLRKHEEEMRRAMSQAPKSRP